MKIIANNLELIIYHVFFNLYVTQKHTISLNCNLKLFHLVFSMLIYYDKISYISKMLEVDPAIKGIGYNILWEFGPGETFLLLLKVLIIEIWWSHNLLYMRYDRKVILLEDLANRRRSSFRWKFCCNLKLTMLRPQINFETI